MSIFTKAFWRAAGERAAKTAAQSALLVIGADQMNALEVEWDDVGGFALGGAVLSILFSLASDAATRGPGPSLTNAEVLATASPPAKDEGGQGILHVLVIVVVVLLAIWLLFMLLPRA